MRAIPTLRHCLTLLLLGATSFPLSALSPLKVAEDKRDATSEAIVSAVNSTQSQQRLNAAIALGRIQKPEGINFLIKLLNDKENSVQKEALFALGQFAWSKEFSKGRELEITEKITPLLKSDDPEIRKAAIESLGKIGLEKAPSLIAPFLKDTHASVRATSVIALYRYRLLLRLRDNITNPAPLSDTDMQTLISLAGDSSKEVRKAVAYYFSRVKDERGKEAVLSLMYSPDLWTRYFATNALSKFQADEQLTLAVLSATEDENYSVRTAAVQAAGAYKIADKLGPSLRGDPSFHVRIAYVQALSSLLTDTNTSEDLLTETKSKLRELYLDSNLSVKAEALKALTQIKNEDAALLVNNALQSPEWVLRVAAVEASNNLEASLKKDILKNAAKDNDVRVRVTALEALAPEESSYAYNLIQEALASEELSERGTAVSDLQSRKESTRFADAFDCYKKSQEEKWIELREEIVKVWAGENTQETNQYLREAVLDKSSSVANLAASTLQERGITDFPEPTSKDELSFSPYRELTFKRNPKLFIETNKGVLTLELYPRQAPIHVANMIGFAEEGKYNGLPIHRVVSNFVIQGGDPDKSGWGSAGYSLRAEINHLPFERGSVGMPRSTGFDTGGVQFFMNHVPTPHLDGQYTVFGKVIENLEVIDQSEVGDVILKCWVEY